MAWRKWAKSAISGSLAAFWSTTVPLQPMEARSTFSVAPTLGNCSSMVAPWRAGASQQISPSHKTTEAPMRAKASKWRSMGRLPRGQPPGMVMEASPKRARRAPRNSTDARILPMRSAGMTVPPARRVSTSRVSPSLVTRPPRHRMMAAARRTSAISGQLCRQYSSPWSMVAARMGKTAFFAPLMVISPERGFPPCTIRASIVSPPLFCHPMQQSGGGCERRRR